MKKFIPLIIAGIIFLVVGVLLFNKKEAPKKVANKAVPLKAKELYKEATVSKEKKNLVKAKELYQDIIINYPEFEEVEEVQKELETLNLNIILTSVEVPNKTVIHEVAAKDTLGKIAKKYGTTVELIKKRNNINSDVIRLGQKLSVWTSPFNVFVDKSQNVLILKEADQIVKVYHVSTGSNNSTPVGTFKVTTKLVDPVWFKSGAIIPPESPQNVLGTRWLGFDIPGYGIHGTTEPELIGQQVTAGCVRMRNEEVEELYSLLPVGTQVVVVD